MEEEEVYDYQTRRIPFEERCAAMLPLCVTHRLGHVSMYASIGKDGRNVVSRMHTVGYRPLGAGFNWWQRKPFAESEAESCGCADKKSLQECFEDEGNWNVSPNYLWTVLRCIAATTVKTSTAASIPASLREWCKIHSSHLF